MMLVTSEQCKALTQEQTNRACNLHVQAVSASAKKTELGNLERLESVLSSFPHIPSTSETLLYIHCESTSLTFQDYNLQQGHAPPKSWFLISDQWKESLWMDPADSGRLLP